MPPPAQFPSTDPPPAAVEFQPSTHQKIYEDDIKRVAALHYWCYVLHAVLFFLQVVLLAMLWDHPERNITIAFENSALTIGLSAFLQAFYTVRTIFSGAKLGLTTSSAVYSFARLFDPTTRPGRFSVPSTKTHHHPRRFWRLGWARRCYDHVMAANEPRRIDRSNPLDLCIPLMRLRSARGILDHHGIRTLHGHCDDGLPGEFYMAQRVCQPACARYGDGRWSSDIHVQFAGAVNRRPAEQHALRYF